MTWQSKTREWMTKRRAPELGDAFVLFFERTFQTPLKLYPHDAWFGVHDTAVSLTIGNMWLAAIAATPRCVYVIVEEDFRLPGMGYIPIRSTLRYAPLGLLTAKPWDLVRAVNKDKRIWDSYARACELILKSPISRNVITRNLYRKARVSELQNAKELK